MRGYWITLAMLLTIASVIGTTCGNEESAVLQFAASMTTAQLEQIEKLREKFSLDFLTHPRAGEALLVTIPVKEKAEFLQKAKEVFSGNIDEITALALKAIDAENKENNARRNSTSKFRNQVSAPTQYYAQLDEIYTWLDTLPRVHRNVQVVNIGNTHEGRPQRVLKLNANQGRPIIFIESGIHSREWLSPATAIYVFDKILNGLFAPITDRFEFHFLFIANPDGYEYTHRFQHSVQGRFWRKNRRAPQSYCVGSDLNRNFDIQFGRVGTSGHCGSDIFPGTHAFSEPETQNERNYLLQIAPRTKMYLSIHTFGQMIIVPYAYTNIPPADDARLRRIGQAAVDAFQAKGRRQYFMGTTQQLGLGLVSGSSVDWVKDVAGIQTAFAFELQPRGVDPLRGGFNPPTSAIGPSGEEASAALMAMLKML